jgi:uncharacterized membrane protein SpoIIM required for sporulation
MSVVQRVEERRAQWEELERLCDALEFRGRVAGGGPTIERFTKLYRATCADLALASAYQLPPGTVGYLHRLVARAHNQLYRAPRWQLADWFTTVFVRAPQQIYADPCVKVATLLFFGLFTAALILAARPDLFPGFAESMVGKTQLETLEQMYDQPVWEKSAGLAGYSMMASFYIWNNTGIGLKCFATGILIIPCLLILSQNALALGAMFGYMARSDVAAGDNFFHFVTAHGPFELTAIALSAAAGLRLGLGFFCTNGLKRSDSLRAAGLRAIPIMAAAATLFLLAALTEAFLSPSRAPYTVKAAFALLASGMLMTYFVVLGFPRGERVEV